MISVYSAWSLSPFYFGSSSGFRCYLFTSDTFEFWIPGLSSSPPSHSHLCMCKTSESMPFVCVWMSICLNNFLSKNSKFTCWVDVFSSPLQYMNNLILILFFLFQPTIFAVFYSCISCFAHELLGSKSTLTNGSDLFQRYGSLNSPSQMYRIYCTGAFNFAWISKNIFSSKKKAAMKLAAELISNYYICHKKPNTGLIFLVYKYIFLALNKLLP